MDTSFFLALMPILWCFALVLIFMLILPPLWERLIDFAETTTGRQTIGLIFGVGLIIFGFWLHFTIGFFFMVCVAGVIWLVKREY